jgi:hypothetical protein
MGWGRQLQTGDDDPRAPAAHAESQAGDAMQAAAAAEAAAAAAAAAAAVMRPHPGSGMVAVVPPMGNPDRLKYVSDCSLP